MFSPLPPFVSLEYLSLLNASYDYRNFISFIRVEIEKVFDPTNRSQFYHSTERSFDRSIDHDRLPPLDGGGTAGMINIVIGKLVTLNSVRILSKACARSIDGVEDRFSPRVR